MSKQEQKGSGFLITCDKYKQKHAIKDAYNFINQYIQDIYGDVQTKLIHKQLDKQGKDYNLQNEMQIRSTLKNKLKLLNSVDTNVNCLIFIKINQKITDVKIDPNCIVDAIMKDVHKQDRQVTRFCHKILPVERSFKAEHFKMLDQIDSLFQQRDNSQMKSWALNFKCRNNSKFSYKQVLAKTQQIAKKYGHFVDIYYPQWTIAVEIVHHLMCISIVQGYKQYDEFRLHKKGQKFNNNNQNFDKAQTIKQKKNQKNINLSKNDKQQKQISNQVLVKQNKKSPIKQVQKNQQKVQQKINEAKKQEQPLKQKQKCQQEQKKVKLLEQKIGVNNQDDIDFI